MYSKTEWLLDEYWKTFCHKILYHLLPVLFTPQCNGNPIYVFLFWELCGRCPIFTFMGLWAVYIFQGSDHIFSGSRIGRSMVWIYKSINRSLTHECGNWDCVAAQFLFWEYFISNFWYCVFAVWWLTLTFEYTVLCREGYFLLPNRE